MMTIRSWFSSSKMNFLSNRSREVFLHLEMRDKYREMIETAISACFLN